MAILKDKTALVTGAASGIGRAAALALAAAGARVAVSDIQEEGGQETVRLIRDQGGEAGFFQADVADKASVEQLFASIFDRYGRLHVAVNNAGVGGIPGPFAEYGDDAWEQVIAVNQTGVFYCMREELRHMQAQGGGAIVNVSSIAGYRALPFAAAYVASKHAVLGMTKTAAAEYARYHIRVNAVCPAFTRTPMVDQLFAIDPSMEEKLLKLMPMRRYGRVEEIANAILWLCDERNGFTTGIGVPVDGGMMS